MALFSYPESLERRDRYLKLKEMYQSNSYKFGEDKVFYVNFISKHLVCYEDGPNRGATEYHQHWLSSWNTVSVRD